MVAPAYRAPGSGGTSTTTETTVPRPTGTTTGDVLYAVIADGGAATPPTTVPTGWTLTVSGVTNSTFWAGVYEHVVTDINTEPADYTWAGLVNSCAGGMVAIIGADTTTPTHEVGATPNLDTNVNAASITTTAAECLIIGAVGVADNQGINPTTSWACATDPTALTHRLQVLSSGGEDSAMAMATAPQAAPGPTGDLTAMLNGSRNNVSFLIAVQPPQDSGGGTVEGTATADLGGLAASAVGVRTVIGAATATSTVTASAAGTRTVQGTAGTVIEATATAAGQRTVTGAATANLGGLTAEATGTRTVTGAARSDLPATAHATGTRTVLGSATATIGVSATADATVTETVLGTATADLGGLTAHATGVRTVEGGATVDLGGLTASAAGTRTVHGTATAVVPCTATAAGQRTVLGAATADLGGVTATAVGSGGTETDITVTVGPASRGWAAGAPTRGWETGTPSRGWATGTPST